MLRVSLLGAVGVSIGACAGGQGSANQPHDFSARFGRFEVTDEPNGDLSKVVWPDFVLRAGAEVRRLYEFQIENGDLMRWMPCFCGCGDDGHRNNRDCYVKQVNPDGSVILDSMAPT
jgi:uncharacterized protein with PCYCGC motif